MYLYIYTTHLSFLAFCTFQISPTQSTSDQFTQDLSRSSAGANPKRRQETNPYDPTTLNTVGLSRGHLDWRWLHLKSYADTPVFSFKDGAWSGWSGWSGWRWSRRSRWSGWNGWSGWGGWCGRSGRRRSLLQCKFVSKVLRDPKNMVHKYIYIVVSKALRIRKDLVKLYSIQSFGRSQNLVYS